MPRRRVETLPAELAPHTLPPPDDGLVLRIRDVATRTRMGVSTIQRLVLKGKFPAGKRLSPGVVVWEKRAVDRWLVKRLATTAAAEKPAYYTTRTVAKAPTKVAPKTANTVAKRARRS